MPYADPNQNRAFVPAPCGHSVRFVRYEDGNKDSLARAEQFAAEHPDDTVILCPVDFPVVERQYVQMTPVVPVVDVSAIVANALAEEQENKDNEPSGQERRTTVADDRTTGG